MGARRFSFQPIRLAEIEASISLFLVHDGLHQAADELLLVGIQPLKRAEILLDHRPGLGRVAFQ